MKRFFLIVLLALLAVSGTSCQQAPAAEVRVEDIHAICELATLKCYYNNVARIEKKKENIFQRDRTMWIEYEGKAVLGVDMAKLKIEQNGANVSITMPAAEILSIDPVRETLNDKSYVSSSDGFLFKNKITTQDQELAIVKGQEEMKEALQNNTALFLQAQTKAKELIEHYIAQLGRSLGKEYVITWK